MNILLVVVLGFIAICSLNGMRRGFIKTVFSMFSLLVTLFLASLVSPVVSNGMQENEKILSYFSDKVAEVLPLEEVVSKVELEAKKTVQTEFLQKLPLPDSIIESLMENNSMDFYTALGVESFEDYVSHYIACMIISAIAFAITFLVIFIILQIVCFSLNLVSKLPIINQINKLFGLAAGFVYAMVIVWLGFILLTAFSSTAFGHNLMGMVSESGLLSYLYNHNLLLEKITDMTKYLF